MKDAIGFLSYQWFSSSEKKRKITATNHSHIDQFRHFSGNAENKTRKKTAQPNTERHTGFGNRYTCERSAHRMIQEWCCSVRVCVLICLYKFCIYCCSRRRRRRGHHHWLFEKTVTNRREILFLSGSVYVWVGNKKKYFPSLSLQSMISFHLSHWSAQVFANHSPSYRRITSQHNRTDLGLPLHIFHTSDSKHALSLSCYLSRSHFVSHTRSSYNMYYLLLHVIFSCRWHQLDLLSIDDTLHYIHV